MNDSEYYESLTDEQYAKQVEEELIANGWCRAEAAWSYVEARLDSVGRGRRNGMEPYAVAEWVAAQAGLPPSGNEG